eukprot:6936-Pleurochrysis_carterae.AAC.1
MACKQQAYQTVQAKLKEEQSSNKQLKADCRKLREELGQAHARAEAAEQRAATKRLEQKLEDMRQHLEAATEQHAASDASHQREIVSLNENHADAARAAKEQFEQRLCQS